MSKTENYIRIKGYVGKDPEYRTTSHGAMVANFIVGTEDLLFGEIKKQWHTIVVTDESLVEKVKKEIMKGTNVEVTGHLYYHKFISSKFYEKLFPEIIVTGMGSVSVLDIDIKTAKSYYN